MTITRRRKVGPRGPSCSPALPAELRQTSELDSGTQVDLVETKQDLLHRVIANKSELSLKERIAKTGVESVRLHGQAFRDLAAIGREIL